MALSWAPSCERADGRGSAIDPRVAWLDNWVPYRRSSDRSLFFLARFETRERDVLAVDPDCGVVVREQDLPVTGCNLPTVLGWARLYWGRLPTYEEWSSAVSGPNTGPDRYRFPWGEDDGSRLHANTLRLSLGRRTRVGTFESGRDLGSRLSCYDLFGNVAEWTIEPWAVVDLHRLRNGDGRHPPISDVFDLAYHGVPDELAVLARLPAGINPLAPATPFLAELCGGLLAPATSRALLCTVGFSFAERVPERHVSVSHWDRNGVRPAYPGETASNLGVRFCTDPYTFLALIEKAGGAPREADLARLRQFLLTHRAEFRHAGLLRLRSMDRDFLGLDAPARWGVAAYRILGLR